MKKALLIVLVLISLFSCKEIALYESNINIANESWNADSTAKFQIDISDTLNAHHIYVNIRNATSYSNSNLYLFIHTTSPSGANLRDTLECILADQRGRWLGKGFGRIRDNRIPYKRFIRFPEQGTYALSIQHGMRTQNLQGVVTVGVRVEKAKH